MSRFFAYDPDQAYLLPPNVKDVLGERAPMFPVAPEGGASGGEPV